jgi:hypothetical protein
MTNLSLTNIYPKVGNFEVFEIIFWRLFRSHGREVGPTRITQRPGAV